MVQILKTLKIDEATLMGIRKGERKHLADFTGKIIIEKHTEEHSILGRPTKGISGIVASFIVGNPNQCISDIHTGMAFEAEGYVSGESECRKVYFSGLEFLDNDPIKGTFTFEVPDLELIELMLKM